MAKKKHLPKGKYCELIIRIPIKITKDITEEDMERAIEMQAKESIEGAIRWLHSQSESTFDGKAEFGKEGTIYFG